MPISSFSFMRRTSHLQFQLYHSAPVNAKAEAAGDPCGFRLHRYSSSASISGSSGSSVSELP
ncbi:MAG: hypothetical protein UD575_14460, partial [Oscillospiraceae bacterium]|nr:hypothetical protein [Oscillospiraceae bacterium]